MAKIDLLSLEEQDIVGGLKGISILLYGSNNLGKSYQASKMTKPLLLMCEPGGRGIKGKKVNITNWATFKAVVDQLVAEKSLDQMKEMYSTIVADGASSLIEMAETAICKEFGVRDLSEINGKMNGYSIYRKDFRSQINRLTSVGYVIVFIMHEEVIEKIDEITGEKHIYIQPFGSDNRKSSSRFLRDICDFTLYAKSRGIDDNGDTIPSILICKETRHVFARSRFAIQTYIEPFTAKNMEEAIIKAIEKSAENENAVLSDWKPDNTAFTSEDWIELIKPYYKKLKPKYGEQVNNIVISELGEKKISACTDEDIVSLENIYNQLVTFACSNGVVVEVE